MNEQILSEQKEIIKLFNLQPRDTPRGVFFLRRGKRNSFIVDDELGVKEMYYSLHPWWGDVMLALHGIALLVMRLGIFAGHKSGDSVRLARNGRNRENTVSCDPRGGRNVLTGHSNKCLMRGTFRAICKIAFFRVFSRFP